MQNGTRPRTRDDTTGQSRDVWLLFGTRAVRLFGFGLLSVILAFYLREVGFSDTEVGVLLTLILVGDAGVSLLVTRTADRLGRRRMLLLGAGLICLAGTLCALSDNLLLVALAAVIGTLSPTGNEVGPLPPIEHAALAQLTRAERRTRLFAWTTCVGSVSGACGAWAGGSLATSLQLVGATPLESYRALFGLYVGLGLLLAVLSRLLSSAVEVRDAVETPTPPSWGLHRSRGTVRNISALFMLDAFGGGLVIQSLLAYWLHLRFGADVASLGKLFFGVNLVSGLSALVAARLAARFGLLNTMVFTHMPANILLIVFPLMPTYGLAILALLLRFSVAQMDVPTRQSYLMAVVDPDERSAAAGITTVARTAAGALAPSLTGVLLGASLVRTPFFLAGGLKLIYDVALFWSFRKLTPPEEGAGD